MVFLLRFSGFIDFASLRKWNCKCTRSETLSAVYVHIISQRRCFYEPFLIDMSFVSMCMLSSCTSCKC